MATTSPICQSSFTLGEDYKLENNVEKHLIEDWNVIETVGEENNHGIFILKNLFKRETNKFRDIVFYHRKLSEEDFKFLESINDTVTADPKEPRYFEDYAKYIQGYGREFVYNTETKKDEFFDPTDY